MTKHDRIAKRQNSRSHHHTMMLLVDKSFPNGRPARWRQMVRIEIKRQRRQRWITRKLLEVMLDAATNYGKEVR